MSTIKRSECNDCIKHINSISKEVDSIKKTLSAVKQSEATQATDKSIEKLQSKINNLGTKELELKKVAWGLEFEKLAVETYYDSGILGKIFKLFDSLFKGSPLKKSEQTKSKIDELIASLDIEKKAVATQLSDAEKAEQLRLETEKMKARQPQTSQETQAYTGLKNSLKDENAALDFLGLCRARAKTGGWGMEPVNTWIDNILRNKTIQLNEVPEVNQKFVELIFKGDTIETGRFLVELTKGEFKIADPINHTKEKILHAFKKSMSVNDASALFVLCEKEEKNSISAWSPVKSVLDTFKDKKIVLSSDRAVNEAFVKVIFTGDVLKPSQWLVQKGDSYAVQKPANES